MFIEAKKLIGLPVAALDAQSKIGEIREILVDPENGRLLGFLIQGGGIFAAKKVLSIVDVREWDPKAIVTESIENIVEPNEIVRIKEVLVKNIILMGMKAKTESGQSLGEVDDLLIDTETQSVVKYYLKDLLGKNRILTSDQVVKIETKGLPFGDKNIVFADDVSEPTGGAVETQAV